MVIEVSKLVDNTGRDLGTDHFPLVAGQAGTGNPQLISKGVHLLTVHMEGPAALDILIQDRFRYLLDLLQISSSYSLSAVWDMLLGRVV